MLNCIQEYEKRQPALPFLLGKARPQGARWLWLGSLDVEHGLFGVLGNEGTTLFDFLTHKLS